MLDAWRAKNLEREWRDITGYGGADTTEEQLTEHWAGKRAPRTLRTDYDNYPPCVTPEERAELLRRHATFIGTCLEHAA